MKKYTFTLPKNNNTATEYKNKLMERVITAYPWLTIEGLDYPKAEFGGVFNATAGDAIGFGISTKHNVSWVPAECLTYPFKRLDGAINFDLEKEFPLAMAALNKYALENLPFEKDYDFEDEFGTPIKIFDNFVQIGYEIIPIQFGSLNHLKPKTKKLIIDIVIKIKNNGLY